MLRRIIDAWSAAARNSKRNRCIQQTGPTSVLAWRRLGIEELESRRLLTTYTWYVAPVSEGGNDSNPGTVTAPFATIQKGLDMATTGTSTHQDAVYVEPGIYREDAKDLSAQGQTSAAEFQGGHVTLEADPNAASDGFTAGSVIVEGTQQITTGWTQLPSATGAIPSSSIYIYEGWQYYFGPQYDPESTAGSTSGYSDDARSEPRNQLFVDGQYIPEVMSLAAMTPGTFYIDQPQASTHNLYLWMPDGSNPTGHDVEGDAWVTTQSNSNTEPFLLSTNNHSYETINGLEFQYCANESQGAGAVQVKTNSDCLVENVTVQYAAGAGISVAGAGNTLLDCYFNHNGEEGIGGGGNGLQVIDCETAYNNMLPGKQYDTIFEAGGCKFAVVTGVLIDGLVSHDNNGPGVWFDVDAGNPTICNCIIYNNTEDGIRCDISYDATIYNNLIFDNRGDGINLWESAGCQVFNNTIYGSGSYAFSSQIAGSIVSNSGTYDKTNNVESGYSYDNAFYDNVVVLNRTVTKNNSAGDIYMAALDGQGPPPSGWTQDPAWPVWSDSWSDYNVFDSSYPNYFGIDGDVLSTAMPWYSSSGLSWTGSTAAGGLDQDQHDSPGSGTTQPSSAYFPDAANDQFQTSAFNPGLPSTENGQSFTPNSNASGTAGVNYSKLLAPHNVAANPTAPEPYIPSMVLIDAPNTVAGATNSNTLVYSVIFSEPVCDLTNSSTSVTAADFQLTASGPGSAPIQAAITSVSPTGTTTTIGGDVYAYAYTVTVAVTSTTVPSSGDFAGTLRLDLKPGLVSDEAGDVSAGYTSGAAAVIGGPGTTSSTPVPTTPEIISDVPSDTDTGNGSVQLGFIVTFNESVDSNVATNSASGSPFTLIETGTASNGVNTIKAAISASENDTTFLVQVNAEDLLPPVLTGFGTLQVGLTGGKVEDANNNYAPTYSSGVAAPIATSTPESSPPTFITVSPPSGTYGGTTSITAALTLGGEYYQDTPVSLANETLAFSLNGTTVGSAMTNSSGIATLSGVNLGGLTAGGPYVADVGVSFAGDLTKQYFGSAETADLTVNPAPLTVTGSGTQVYGGSPSFAASYSSFVLGQGPSALGGSLGYSTTTASSSNVGTYSAAVTPSGLTSSNYALTFVPGAMVVNAAPLTVTGSGTQVYGGSPSFAASYSSFVLGQNAGVLSGSLGYSTTTTGSSNAGTYSEAVTPSGLTSSNYTITFTPGAMVVSTAPLTVTGSGTQVYGGTPSFNVGYNGFVLGQNAGELGGSLGYSTTTTSSNNVGTYSAAVTPSGLTSSNYALTFAPGAMVISQASLTVTGGGTQVYGGTPTYSAGYNGFVLGQNAGELGGSLGYSTTTSTNSNVGTYSGAVTPNGLTSSNYAITYTSGAMLVSAAPLIVTGGGTQVYGGSPSYSASYSGFVLGQGASVLSGTLGYSTTTTASSNVGTYKNAVTPSGLTSSNYAISFAPGPMVISQATPLVSVNDSGGSYSGSPYTASGSVSGVSGAGLGTPSLNYYNGSSATGTPLGSAPVNSGTYTVLASYGGSLDYTSASATKTFAIGLAPPTVTLPAPPTNLIANGTNSVTSWVVATVTGISGAPAPTGGLSYAYYAGTLTAAQIATATSLSAPPITAGTYTVVANYGGNSNYAASQSSPVTFAISAPTSPVNVTSFQINGANGGVQRSMVNSLTVNFNAPVTLSAGALVLTDTTTNQQVAISWSPSSGPSASYVVTWSGSQIIGGSLANGNYTLTVKHALVSSTSGTMTADQSYSFYRLFGDFQGTGTVNAADYTIFKKANGAAVGTPTYNTYWYCDYYYQCLGDTGINSNDLTQFLDDYGMTL